MLLRKPKLKITKEKAVTVTPFVAVISCHIINPSSSPFAGHVETKGDEKCNSVGNHRRRKIDEGRVLSLLQMIAIKYIPGISHTILNVSARGVSSGLAAVAQSARSSIYNQSILFLIIPSAVWTTEEFCIQNFVYTTTNGEGLN